VEVTLEGRPRTIRYSPGALVHENQDLVSHDKASWSATIFATATLSGMLHRRFPFFLLFGGLFFVFCIHMIPPFFTARQTLPLGIAGALTTEAYFITG
jgi:hypothetical protein